MAVIVIVDDDPTVRLIATELLRPDDHVVVEAQDGDEALKVIASMAVDLVVLDMLMPNKDGLETIVELRRNHPHIRILAISSGGRVGADQLLRTAMMLGADDTLVKPLRLETFAPTISRLLSQPQPAPMLRVGGA
ncbi:MAG: response regulator [Brevundimonas sp.]|nr:response regulator [Brevundimonas sp.]